MYAKLPNLEIVSIALLRCQFGHEESVEVDPYFDARDWHAAARSDGRSYGGVVERVPRNGDTLSRLLRRAEARAVELREAADQRTRDEWREAAS